MGCGDGLRGKRAHGRRDDEGTKTEMREEMRQVLRDTRAKDDILGQQVLMDTVCH